MSAASQAVSSSKFLARMGRKHYSKDFTPSFDRNESPLNLSRTTKSFAQATLQLNTVSSIPKLALHLAPQRVLKQKPVAIRARNQLRSRSTFIKERMEAAAAQADPVQHSVVSAAQLERELADRLRGLDTTDWNQYCTQVYLASQLVFEKVIEIDRAFGNLLLKLKTNYENYIKSCYSPQSLRDFSFDSLQASPSTATSAHLELKLKEAETKERQYRKVLRALHAQGVPIEALYQQHCQAKPHGSSRAVAKQSVPAIPIPRNDTGFHQEFLAKVSEFSPSWRTLAEELNQRSSNK